MSYAEIKKEDFKKRINIQHEKIKKDRRREKAPTINNYEVWDIVFSTDWNSEYIIVPSKEADVKKIKEIITEKGMEYTKLCNERGLLYVLLNSTGKTISNDEERQEIEKLMDQISDAKIKEKVEKDFTKNKISKELKNIVNENIEILNKKITNFERNISPNLYKPIETVPQYLNIPTPEITYYDTIPNPLFKKNLPVDLYYSLLYEKEFFPNLISIYSWISNEKGKEIEEKYPEPIKYLSYESHPDLRVITKNEKKFNDQFASIYDNKGNLVDVNYPMDIDINIDNLSITSPLLLGIAKIAYLDDAHKIQSAEKNTKDYLTKELGLREKTKQELQKEERLGNALLSGNKKSMKRELTRAVLNVDQQAINWLNQIADDNKNNFDLILNIERLDNKRFKVTYGDSKGQPTYDIIYTYRNNINFWTDKIELYTFSRDITVNKSTFIPTFEQAFSKNTSNQEKNEKSLQNNEEIYTSVEIPAEFVGGYSALIKWIDNNLKYPEKALNDKIEGRCLVKLVIEEDGTISDLEIVRKINDDLEREAIRLVNKMPKWNPAKNNGKEVRSYFTLPINFKLPKQM